MKKYAVIIFLVLTILLIPSIVDASHESESNLEVDESCIFTAFIEKSWVFFTERSWVTGWVTGCDSQSWEYTPNEILYAMKDTIQVKILDIDGNLVDDHIADKDNIPFSDEIVYSKYSFRDYVYRGGQITAHLDAAHKGPQYLQENQYYFEMPQINSRDFEHRGVYQIELTYGDHVRTIWFAVLNPELRWDEVEPDPCLEYYEKELKKLESIRQVLERQLIEYESDQVKVITITLKLDELEKEMELLKECQI